MEKINRNFVQRGTRLRGFRHPTMAKKIAAGAVNTASQKHSTVGSTATLTAMLSQSTRRFSSVVNEPLRRPDSMHAGQRCCPCNSTSHNAQTNLPHASHGTCAVLCG